MKEFIFDIPKGEVIPTNLRLKYGDVSIIYYRDKDDSLTWHIDLYNVKDQEEANDIVNKMVNTMCIQSYDHGAEWRSEGIEIGDSHFNSFSSYAEYIVHFRIKDTW